MEFLQDGHATAAGVSHAVGKLTGGIGYPDVRPHVGIGRGQRLAFGRVPRLGHLQHPLLIGQFAFPHLLVEALFLNHFQIIEAGFIVGIQPHRFAEFRLGIRPLPVVKIELAVPQHGLDFFPLALVLRQLGQRLLADQPAHVRRLDHQVEFFELQRLLVLRIDVQHLLGEIRRLGKLTPLLLRQGL